MKTNHQRGFKDTRNPRAVYSHYYVGGGELTKLPLSDRMVGAKSVTCGDHTNAKRGIAKDRRGAKKYVVTRTRFHENAATRRLAQECIDESSV